MIADVADDYLKGNKKTPKHRDFGEFKNHYMFSYESQLKNKFI